MNRNLTRIAGAAMLLLIALVVATTYWQTLARAELADRQDNAIQRVVEFTVERGRSPRAAFSWPGTALSAGRGERSSSAAIPADR